MEKRKKEPNTEAKLDILEKLAARAMYVQPNLIDEYISKGVYLAEQSRDRNLMVKARRIAVGIYINGGTEEKVQQAKKYAIEALAISKQDGVSYKEKVRRRQRRGPRSRRASEVAVHSSMRPHRSHSSGRNAP